MLVATCATDWDLYMNAPGGEGLTRLESRLRDFLSDPVRLKWFNIAMGLALVASVAPMLR